MLFRPGGRGERRAACLGVGVQGLLRAAGGGDVAFCTTLREGSDRFVRRAVRCG